MIFYSNRPRCCWMLILACLDTRLGSGSIVRCSSCPPTPFAASLRLWHLARRGSSDRDLPVATQATRSRLLTGIQACEQNLTTQNTQAGLSSSMALVIRPIQVGKGGQRTFLGLTTFHRATGTTAVPLQQRAPGFGTIKNRHQSTRGSFLVLETLVRASAWLSVQTLTMMPVSPCVAVAQRIQRISHRTRSTETVMNSATVVVSIPAASTYGHLAST